MGFFKAHVDRPGMRVAMVAMATAHHRDARGTRRFDRIARQLADAGHDVTVFCAQWWPESETERMIDDVRYRGVTLGTAKTAFCARLPALLAAHRPDVVHTMPVPPVQVIAARVGARFARAPLVLEWFGDEDLDADARLTRRAISEPTMVVTPSELIRTEVRELGASTEGTTVIPESIDIDRVRTVEPADTVDVVFASRLDEAANVGDFLLGLAELRNRGWRATVIGEGPQRSTIEEEAADLRIDDRVTFAGACDRDERIAIYRGAHAFVQTSHREPFPLELLWGLAAGCVGIVEYQAESAAHELVEGDERSFRVTDAQELADAIVDAGDLEHRTFDDRWAAYDHETVRGQYVDTYDRLR